MGNSTHLCASPTPTVNGCDLTPPTRTQTSEQEYSDLIFSDTRPSTTYSNNTTKNFLRGNRLNSFSGLAEHA